MCAQRLLAAAEKALSRHCVQRIDGHTTRVAAISVHMCARNEAEYGTRIRRQTAHHHRGTLHGTRIAASAEASETAMCRTFLRVRRERVQRAPQPIECDTTLRIEEERCIQVIYRCYEMYARNASKLRCKRPERTYSHTHTHTHTHTHMHTKTSALHALEGAGNRRRKYS